MKKLSYGVLFLLTLALTTSCQKKSDFLYYVNPGDIKTSSKIKELGNGNRVDMLWVIGGMTEMANAFNTGVTTFMNAFVLNKGLSWRMGVISTDPRQKPFLGMGPAGVFDDTSPNPGPTLVNAVMQVLNSYDGEQMFDPTVKALTDYPQFMRPGATLAVIMTNDAHDSSTNTVRAQDMLNFLAKAKGSLDQVIVYGIIGATDLGCARGTIDEDWNYHGSPLETVINTTGGQGLSLCNNNFGTLLAQISDHLLTHILHSKIFLAKKPVPSTIKVTYQGKVLPGGPKENGGYWLYNVHNNSIVFYDLSFASNDDDSVEVTYTEDVGTGRK